MSSPASAHSLLGTIVDGRYRIVRLIGHGGMGAVYEAEAIRLKRMCACKVLLPEFTRDEGAIARFEREAMAAARVDHPNVVKIHDTGTIRDGSGYIAMDLLRGESLDRTLRRERRLPWPRARHVAIQICRALAAAHAQGVVHRDLKPENCFRISQDGDPDFIKLVDFGIARLSDPGGDDARRLTATNAIVGTYAYMAHELVAGRDCDHRVDVWAVGVVLYELLTGVLPFRGQNRGQILTAILTETPARMSAVAPDADIPEAVERIVARALEKCPERRFASATELAQALAGVEAGDGAARPVFTPLTLVPSVEVVDAMASTVTGAHRPWAPRGTETADPYDVTDESRLSPVVVESHVRDGASAEVAVEASVGAVRPPTPRDVPEPRHLRQRIAASGLVAGAIVAALFVPAWGRPSVELQPPTASHHSFSSPEAPATVPREAAIVVPLAGPGSSVDAAAPGDSAAPASAPARALERPRKPPASVKPRAETSAEKIKRELSRLARSAGVRNCLATHRPESLRADIEISAATGRVVRLTAQPLMRGSALERCIERESRGWQLPTGGANYVGTQEFKLAP